MLNVVIGDIHGELEKLKALLGYCREYLGADVRLIFVGDYVNRGPNSSEVVQLLRDLQDRNDHVICLRGNHEAALLAAVAGAPIYHFLLMGGDATLRSYDARSIAEIPASHVEWLKSLPAFYQDELRFYVHAGVDPDCPLDRQPEDALLWIREPFLSDPRPYERLIVHGHTAQLTFVPEVRENRINIDTAAVFGGPLTAAIFSDGSRYPIEFLDSDGRRWDCRLEFPSASAG